VLYHPQFTIRPRLRIDPSVRPARRRPSARSSADRSMTIVFYLGRLGISCGRRNQRANLTRSLPAAHSAGSGDTRDTVMQEINCLSEVKPSLPLAANVFVEDKQIVSHERGLSNVTTPRSDDCGYSKVSAPSFPDRCRINIAAGRTSLCRRSAASSCEWESRANQTRNSREAAKEYSPRRKPWVNIGNDSAPKGRKNKLRQLWKETTRANKHLLRCDNRCDLKIDCRRVVEVE